MIRAWAGAWDRASQAASVWCRAGLMGVVGLALPALSAEPVPVSAASPFASSSAPESPDGPDPQTAVREAELLRAVNDYRAAQGLSRWRPDPGLAAIARAHSRRMAREGRLSHEGFRQRALRSGSPLCVENLVAGHASPEQAVAMWRRSPAHHANVLEARALWAGVGVSGRFATLLACATPAAESSAASAPSGPSGPPGPSAVPGRESGPVHLDPTLR